MLNIRTSKVSHWQNRNASDKKQPIQCFGQQNNGIGHHRADDLGLTGIRYPNKQRLAGRYCLQRNLRRRHRPGLGRRTKEIKSALSNAEKPTLWHEKSTKLTDTESVKLKTRQEFY